MRAVWRPCGIDEQPASRAGRLMRDDNRRTVGLQNRCTRLFKAAEAGMLRRRSAMLKKGYGIVE